MVNKKFTIAMVLGLGAMLIGCSKQPSGPVKFTDAQLGRLKGEFVSSVGTLYIDGDGATVDLGIAEIPLQNKSISGKGFKTEITYTGQGLTYKITWSEGDKKVPVMTCVGEKGEIVFKPSLSAYEGWYTGYGDANYYNIAYCVSNDFDPATGLFYVGMASTNYGSFEDSAYSDTYYAMFGNEIQLGWDFYYASDLEEPFDSYYLSKAKEDKIDIMFPDGTDFMFESSGAMPFNFKYFDLDQADQGLYQDGLFFSSIDEDEKTVYVGWDDEPSTYVEGYDDFGSYVEVKDMLIRGTRFGVTVQTEEELEEEEIEITIAEMPFLDASSFYEFYDETLSYGEETICYTMDWDTWEDVVQVNGVTADSTTLTIYNHKVAFKAEVGENVYHLIPRDKNEAVTVFYNDEERVYINVPLFQEIYVKDYFLEDGGSFSISDELVVDYKGAFQIQGNIKYTEEYGVVFYFPGDDLQMAGNIFCKPLNEKNGLFVMFAENDLDSYDYMVDKALVESLCGDWSCGTKTLSIDANGVKVDGTQVINGLQFTVFQDSAGNCYPAIYGLTAKHAVVLTAEEGVALFEDKENKGKYEYVANFVPKAMFDAAVGTYCYDGKFGIEKIILEANGKLTVDTLKQDESGVEPIVYDYTVGLYEGEMYLTFQYKGFGINVNFNADGNHCNIFDINYLRNCYYVTRGIYEDGTNILTVIDDKIVYNGQQMVVTNEGGGVFVGTIGGVNATVIFGTTDVTVGISGQNDVVLNKSALTLASFAGDGTNVSDLGFDISIRVVDGFGKIYIWNTTVGEEGKTEVTDYSYVLEGGKVVLKFTYAAMKYTVRILDEGGVSMTGESGLPPLPPM